MANLWCIETNTGYQSVNTPDYLAVDKPFPAQAVGHDGNVYLINPDSWPVDDAGNLLDAGFVTLADDGMSLRAKTVEELTPPVMDAPADAMQVFLAALTDDQRALLAAAL